MKKNQIAGYLLIESLIAVVVFVFIGISLFSSISLLQLRALKSKYDSEATTLVQEGVEIVHSTLVSDWGGYSDGIYHPVFDTDNNDWILENGGEIELQTRFNREIRLIEVCRNTTDGEQITSFEETGICPGEIDINSRIIEVKVDWREDDKDKTVFGKLLVYKVPD